MGWLGSGAAMEVSPGTQRGLERGGESECWGQRKVGIKEDKREGHGAIY